MTRTAFAAAACAALLIAGPALAQQKPSQATIEAYVKSTFGKASPEWVARITPDESLAVCNATRNNVTSASRTPSSSANSPRSPIRPTASCSRLEEGLCGGQ